MAPEEKAEAAGSLSASSPGGGGKLTVILTTVNLVATLGLGAIVTLSHLKEKNRPAVEDIAAQPEAESTAAEGAKDEHGGGGGRGDAKDARGRGDGKDSKKGHEYGKMVTLEQFTVNLATPGSVSPKFVRVNVSLEVQNDDVEGEVTSKMPQVRNAIIDLFNSKRPTDLATAEGREYLKEEIRNAINGFMVTGKVKGVYFTNFAVSS